MRFNYYKSLSARNKKIYDASDGIERVALPAPASLHPFIPELEAGLKADDRARVQDTCRKLAAGMVTQLAIPSVDIKVLAVRPSNDYGELHGLYEGVEGRLKTAKITLWMRTAQKKQVVAFRSFLRTFLHEVCHHLDYEHLKLADSYHTQGFYKRESSLFYQLVPDAKPVRPQKAKSTP
jgi:hypothetical protein